MSGGTMPLNTHRAASTARPVSRMISMRCLLPGGLGLSGRPKVRNRGVTASTPREFARDQTSHDPTKGAPPWVRIRAAGRPVRKGTSPAGTSMKSAVWWREAKEKAPPALHRRADAPSAPDTAWTSASSTDTAAPRPNNVWVGADPATAPSSTGSQRRTGTRTSRPTSTPEGIQNMLRRPRSSRKRRQSVTAAAWARADSANKAACAPAPPLVVPRLSVASLSMVPPGPPVSIPTMDDAPCRFQAKPDAPSRKARRARQREGRRR